MQCFLTVIFDSINLGGCDCCERTDFHHQYHMMLMLASMVSHTINVMLHILLNHPQLTIALLTLTVLLASCDTDTSANGVT